MCRPCARRKSPRALSLRFIERRVSGDRPVRSVWPFSCRRAPPRKYTATGLRHSSKRCSPRQRRLDQKRESLPERPARRRSTSTLVVGCGACIAPWRARRTSVQAEAEKYELAWCLRHQRQGSSSSLASCHSDPETTSKIRGPGTTKPRPDCRTVTRERCLSSIESEASSETGSFRRRAPVAAQSSVDRAASDSNCRRSGHAFFRVTTAETDFSLPAAITSIAR